MPHAKTTQFRHWCANNLLAHYADLATLEEVCLSHGVDRLQEDLMTAFSLKSPDASVWDYEEQLILSFWQHEAYHLRQGIQAQSITSFAKQILNRCIELEVPALAKPALKRLRELAAPYLALEWRFGPQSPRLERTLTGHLDVTTHVTITPDGYHAISASAERSLRVWNLLTGQEEHLLIGHQDTINSVIALGDNCHAVSASADGTLKFWTFPRGTEEYSPRFAKRRESEWAR